MIQSAMIAYLIGTGGKEVIVGFFGDSFMPENTVC